MAMDWSNKTRSVTSMTLRGDGAVLSASKLTNKNRPSLETSFSAPLFDILCILGGSALSIGVCGFLGWLGLPFGLDVSPVGEDYVWIDLLQRGHGPETANLWWVYSQRNPFAPWWHILAKHVILGFDGGLLALRYAIAAALALSAYYMLLTITGRCSRLFALALSLVIVFSMASSGSPLIWNFQGALCASLLSVATYAHFFRAGRPPYLLLSSIVFYFLAVATYTIQCGAALAIGYLALRRRWASGVGRSRAVMFAICDTIPYGALFGLFLLIWRTTVSPGAVATFSLHFSPRAALASLREGLWNTDFSIFFSRAYGSPDWGIMATTAAACGLLSLLVVRLRSQTSDVQGPVIGLPQILDVLIVLGCIAAPTVALESGGQYWPPGSRWPEIYQVTSPAIFLICGLVIFSFIIRVGELRRWLLPALVGTAVAIAEFFWLGCDQHYVQLTRNDKHIRDSIIRLVSEDLALGRRPPEQILLLLHGAARGGTALAVLSPEIARAWLHRDDISFRPVNWLPLPTIDFSSWWKVRFGSDSEGVQNAKVFGGTVPYAQVRILEISSRTARRVLVADRADFAGLEVEWNRENPIVFPGVDLAKLCPLRWFADQDVLASGWALPEHDQQGAFRWTTDSSARLTFPAVCPDHSTLRIVVARAVGESEDNLVLWANGRKLQNHRHTVDGNIVYESEFPSGTLSTRSTVDLELAANALHPASGTDNRQVGGAVRSIEILPPAAEGG